MSIHQSFKLKGSKKKRTVRKRWERLQLMKKGSNKIISVYGLKKEKLFNSRPIKEKENGKTN